LYLYYYRYRKLKCFLVISYLLSLFGTQIVNKNNLKEYINSIVEYTFPEQYTIGICNEIPSLCILYMNLSMWCVLKLEIKTKVHVLRRWLRIDGWASAVEIPHKMAQFDAFKVFSVHYGSIGSFLTLDIQRLCCIYTAVMHRPTWKSWELGK
jgi:hypothetical protein